MKDDKLSSVEKQQKIQELMRIGDGIVGLTKKDAEDEGSGENADFAAVKVDDKMELEGDDSASKLKNDIVGGDQEGEKTQPPAAVAAMKSPPPPINNSMNTTTTRNKLPTPPSNEWKQFIQHTPRCASAENIRNTSVFYNKHTSSSMASDMAVPKCLKRLFKELDGLKNDLPSDPNCSIWLRFDDETPQYIRALITAPLGTPYSGGVFAFDIYIPNDYPQTNPKVQLLTTGGGTVRFGPNLYADGKVCLSLLGTWSGPKWNSKYSSIYQVLISIQGLILGVEHPYYLEPGHGGWEGTVKDGDFQHTGHTLSGQSVKQEIGVPLQVILYEDVLRVGTVKHAIVQPIKSSLQKSSGLTSDGLEAFSDIILAHFYENHTNVLDEVRTWMCDDALGRNRSQAHAVGQRRRKALGHSLDGAAAAGSAGGGKGTILQIDALKPLLAKLEQLLAKISMPQSSSASSLDESVSKVSKSDEKMDVEDDEELKPAAEPEKANISIEQSTSATSMDPVEQRRQQMQQAAASGDYIAAGKLQEEIKRLEELQKGMNEAAQQMDFIRAGKLQLQFKALTEVKAGNMKASAAHQSTSSSAAAWNHESSDDGSNDDNSNDDDSSDGEYGHGNEDMDWDDEDEMEGPPFGAGMGGGPGPSFASMPSQQFPKNVFAPPGYKQKYMMPKKHPSTWGAGYTLAEAAQARSAAMEDNKMAAKPQKPSIPLDELCRLRIRLPQNKSVVEDFDKNAKLSEVYNRLNKHMTPDKKSEKKQRTVTGPSAQGGGAFSQPLSSAGYTLLLTMPKMEFNLEMHGTKSLDSLNLAPSATLTVMYSQDRGIALRGEVECRLNAAQGDAMDVEGLTYEGLMELTERVGGAGDGDGAFLALTTEEFEAHTQKLTQSAYFADLESDSEEEDHRCPICLGCYDEHSADNVFLRKVKSCGHIMHQSCLQTWLASKSSCPLCKVSIVDDDKKKMSSH